jgi:hypothetical protein
MQRTNSLALADYSIIFLCSFLTIWIGGPVDPGNLPLPNYLPVERLDTPTPTCPAPDQKGNHMQQSVAYAYATATAAMTSIPTRLHGIYISSTSGSATVTVTDGNGGATVLLLSVGATNASQAFIFPSPIMLSGGVYATISGTAPKVTIAYS